MRLNYGGRLAGVSGQSIYNWEAGKARPRHSALLDLDSNPATGPAVVAYFNARNTLVNTPTATATNGIDAGEANALGFANGGTGCPQPVFP